MKTYTGTVVQVSPYGFAFIFSEEVNKRFFHLRTNWNGGSEPPVVGDECTFELGPSDKPGFPDQAVNVRPTGRRYKVRVPRPASQVEVKTTIDGVTTTSVVGGGSKS